jgi:negative regulator of flagellin synthesis FlgM
MQASVNQVNGNIERARAAMAATALRSSKAYSAAPTNAPARQPDAVELSQAARSLNAAQKAVGSAPEVRADRIAAIKAGIADGSYTVDSRVLAQAMVSKAASI